jgi:hypothetical protein
MLKLLCACKGHKHYKGRKGGCGQCAVHVGVRSTGVGWMYGRGWCLQFLGYCSVVEVWKDNKPVCQHIAM